MSLFSTPSKTSSSTAVNVVATKSPNKAALSENDLPLSGVYFVSILNKHDAQVLPSTKNFLGNLQIRVAKLDSGANVSLFFFEDNDQLEQCFTQFDSGKYKYTIVEASTVSSNIYIMQVALKNKNNLASKIHLDVTVDIFPDRNDRTIYLDVVHFHLCSEDIDVILKDSTKLERFTSAVHQEQLKYFAMFQKVMSKNVLAKMNIASSSPPVAKHSSDSSSSSSDTTAAIMTPLPDGEDDDDLHTDEKFSTGEHNAITKLERRKWSLIGKDVTKLFRTVENERVSFHVNHEIHKLQSWTWDMVGGFEANILSKNYLNTGTPLDIAGLQVVTNNLEVLQLPAMVEEVLKFNF